MGAFLQGNELLLLLAVLLLILGPTKLPQLARGLGQAMREFKKASQGLYDEETVKQVKEVEKNKSSPNEVDAETLKKLAEK
nr:twin-arginine translocase TatA/TatE family subunit [Desulfurococcales archaeon]